MTVASAEQGNYTNIFWLKVCSTATENLCFPRIVFGVLTAGDDCRRIDSKRAIGSNFEISVGDTARLIAREILPGNRAYTTRLLPDPDPELKELKKQLDGMV